MTYRQTLDYLYAQLPMFSRLGSSAIKNNLDNILKLCATLGQPQEKFSSIHIAGTNGKGSTSHMLAAVLQDAGYKTGLYTSPHLVDFRERIRINGEMLSEQWVVSFVAAHSRLMEEIQPSFFEITVAMAFIAFAEAGVDIAVIETGLGGRLDSTNIITPILSVITNISYDHMDMLGNTLPLIAAEKAGIIKRGIPVVIGAEQGETAPVFFEAAHRNAAPLIYADAVWDAVRTGTTHSTQQFKLIHRSDNQWLDVTTDLQGSYQSHNLKTVFAALDVLSAKGWSVELPKAAKALQQVKALTGLRGRWEVLSQTPFIVCDVGHNEAGMKEVMPQWASVTATNKYILIGFVKDKDVRKALSVFPKDARYLFTQAQIPRALPAEDLAAIAKDCGLTGQTYPTVAAAIAAAQSTLNTEDALLITGSFFIVGEAMEALEKPRYK